MTDLFDPEVAADLRLRDETVRERGRGLRNRDAATDAIYDWQPEPIVGQWRCRRPGCNGWIPVPASAMERLAEVNGILRARGEEPADLTSPVVAKERACRAAYCDVCRAEYDRQLPDRRRKQVERLAEMIRELKASRDPAGERELLLQLRELGMSETETRDLVQAIATSKATAKPRRDL